MMEEHDSLKQASRYIVGTTDGTEWKPGHPLRVDGCMLMLCERGSVDITINSRRFTMAPGEMAFLVLYMVAVPVKKSDDFKARFITLDYDEAQDIFFLITSNRFWEYVYTDPIFIMRPSLHHAACRWFSQITWIARHCSEITAGKALRNEVENFMLIMAEQVESHLGSLGTNPPKNRAWVIVNEFLGLLNRYYAHLHDVAFYAERLNITPNYLNIIVRRNIGTTAKEQINIQLGLVVKMLLDTTDLTVKEIAERLHYDDPSYLCRIFRKLTGQSPLQYRNTLRNSQPVGDNTD